MCQRGADCSNVLGSLQSVLVDSIEFVPVLSPRLASNNYGLVKIDLPLVSQSSGNLLDKDCAGEASTTNSS
jgi:hypothetical protein